MHPEQLPPMAGSSEGLHHDHELVCIEAKKVFDICFQEHHIERSFTDIYAQDTKKLKARCEIDENGIICRETEKREPVVGKEGKFLVCLAIEVPVTIRLFDEYDCQPFCKTFHRRIVFAKQVILCAPKGTDIQCNVTGNCCCIYDRENKTVVCDFDFCIVVKAKADVNLLVPTFGHCALRECHGINCPPKPPRQCDEPCKEKRRECDKSPECN